MVHNFVCCRLIGPNPLHPPILQQTQHPPYLTHRLSLCSKYYSVKRLPRKGWGHWDDNKKCVGLLWYIPSTKINKIKFKKTFWICMCWCLIGYFDWFAVIFECWKRPIKCNCPYAKNSETLFVGHSQMIWCLTIFCFCRFPVTQ